MRWCNVRHSMAKLASLPKVNMSSESNASWCKSHFMEPQRLQLNAYHVFGLNIRVYRPILNKRLRLGTRRTLFISLIKSWPQTIIPLIILVSAQFRWQNTTRTTRLVTQFCYISASFVIVAQLSDTRRTRIRNFLMSQCRKCKKAYWSRIKIYKIVGYLEALRFL